MTRRQWRRCPWLTKVISPAVPLYNGLVFLFVLANFSMATFMDPGVYPRVITASYSDRITSAFSSAVTSGMVPAICPLPRPRPRKSIITTQQHRRAGSRPP
ncbi:probable palmitoyltransferase ZDHHC8 isoform X1 [Lates japonicus]|uniref:Probable palmitoyltransferase ZDHHC8 isoform X1 n=1 Tax=Lates japonicus TaxID=270547 RepID=A0AAD3NE70_LATJO|nr:probable palmitoyltransferase ZDHHC8 isoform X1 [Lates japonicus]